MWTQTNRTEGRRSVDAVLVAVIVGGLLLTEAAPWDVDSSDGMTVAGVLIARAMGGGKDDKRSA